MKQCPFCHSENVTAMQTAYIFEKWVVMCGDCGARGPDFGEEITKEEAERRWDANIT